MEKEEFDKLVDFIPSVLSYIETFKKTCIIIDECTVENYIQKLIEVLRYFDLIKYDFSSNKKEKTTFFVPVFFGPEHKLEKNGIKILFWGFNWIRNVLYGLLFLQIQKFSDFMHFYMMQLDL